MSETTICQVADCMRPSDDWVVCRSCAKDAEKVLTETPWLLASLDTAISRQVRMTSGGGPTTAETPVLFNVRASEVKAELMNDLTTTARIIADVNGWEGPASLRVVPAWLLYRLSAIRLHPLGGQFVDAMRMHHAAGIWAIDRPAEKWFAGVCSMETPTGICPRDLYASTSTGDIECPSCGYRHDVDARREVLLKYAEDVLATATEAARAITVWSDYERGENRLVKRIGMWEERGRIERRGIIPMGGKDRPLYRIGDILDLLGVDMVEKAG